MIVLSVSLSVSFQYPLSYAQITIPEEVESNFKAQQEATKKTPEKAFLLIFSDVGWSATILDSGLDTFTQDGTGSSKIEFECAPGFMSTYSVSVQKDSEAGALLIILIQNGVILDATNTMAAYGIVSLAGNCGEPEELSLNRNE